MRIDNISTVPGDTGFVGRSVTEQLTITSTGVTPVSGTVTVNHINLRDDGSGWCDVIFNYRPATNGSTTGSGDYLVALPGGYSFDTTYHSVYTGVEYGNSNAYYQIIPGSWGIVSNSALAMETVIMPYTSTTFRVWTTFTAVYGTPTGYIRKPWSATLWANLGTITAQGEFRFKKA